MEVLFRAINRDDEIEYQNDEDIKCLLLKTIDEKSSKKKKTYYNLCINGNGEYALDTIIGHIHGGKLKTKNSCWVSTTSSFDMACSEYAVPQTGKYNQFGYRKNIIKIEVPKEKILSDKENIQELRQSPIVNDVFIDLRNQKLQEYYNSCIFSENYNENMPGYDVVADINRKYLGDTKITGFSNYATAASEVLAYKQIKKEYISTIYYPMEQDIFYGCSSFFDLDLNMIDLASKYLSIEERELFHLLYPSLEEGNNLTDIFIENYSSIEGQNIYEKYEILKKQKYQLLSKLLKLLNTKYSEKDYSLKRLIDDGILVYSTNTSIRRPLSRTSVNDIVILEHEGDIYKFDNSKRVFESSDGLIYSKRKIRWR